ncbi:gonadotropin subunit beta-2-like [Mugil cephalus]|uniref:gonadotropin subunit beta-2-like n=1 Tax=Mugil cephalus TaxID=48193 RepID=UPI001FB83119|nr:gonadotropin subunit beta-2-like [Mugil cephalus]XP_047458242.1 gonadotropin subunit beta-2-like [Mugil cephalus]
MMAQVSTATSPLILSLFFGTSSFIWAFSPAAPTPFQLSSCQLINQTVFLEKKGCPRCHPVETTICSGLCPTKDPVKIPYRNVYQHVCTYREWYYKSFELPDCLHGVDPIVTYPAALSCHCGPCTMDTSDCTFESLQPDFCMNDIPFYY